MGIETALLVGGGILGAAGSISSANAQAKASRANASVAEQNAQIALEQASDEERQSRILARKNIGESTANYAAGGLKLEGSPLDVIAESSANAERDAQNIKKQGQMKANALRAGAKADLSQAKNAQIGGIFSATSSLLNTGAKVYKGVA